MIFFAGALLSLGKLGIAQEWPTKPIRMIVPQAAGGGPERTIRAIAKGLSDRLGQPVVVDYKAGANGNIAAADLARSAPDGYTWMLSPEHVATINPFIYRSIGYNRENVSPTFLVGSLNQILACHPKTGINKLSDLVRVSQADKSKRLSYGSPGAGSNGHLAMEMLLDELKIDMTHVPYRGPAPAVQDLIGGQVDCVLTVTSALAEHVKSQRVVGVVTTSLTRLPSLPDIPTMRDVALPAFDGNFWLAMFAPKGVSNAVLDKFNQALDETVRGDEVRGALAASNTFMLAAGPLVARTEIARAAAKWQRVAKRVNFTLD
jgi:tripartite-type tricarboxylate transporter receptor subunit TctC